MANIFKGQHEFSEPLLEEEIKKECILNKSFFIQNHILKISKRKKGFSLSGVLYIKDNRENESDIELKDPHILMGEFQYQINSKLHLSLSKKTSLLVYKTYIPYCDILEAGLHTVLHITATNKDGVGYKKQLKYIAFMPTRPSILWHSPIKEFPSKNISVFFRQGSKNFVYATAPEIKISNRFGQRIKIALAFVLSRMLFFVKTVVLFEKQSEEYQASASVMFERLIDLGYKRVYFILDRDVEKNYVINEKYRRSVVWKYSFKHYLVFFMSRLYLSSESIYHATELRTINRFIHLHVLLTKAKIPYIFLQHGVMYMVRLDAKYRWGFRYGRMFKENSRVVVSSELEAKHFMDYGNFPKENLYVTGLAQWDRVEYNSLDESADRIMIIPTWRHWELAQARVNPEETGYYKLMERIVRNIPKEYERKIILVPHPLVIEYFKNTELGKYIPKNTNSWISYLDRVRLLITDYSSISYFAFYRGSNIIFDWSDLEECMEIGYDGALMLNEQNVFGDVVYNESKELANSIEENISRDRKDEYVKRYHRIVQFKDGHNADRIVEKLRRDGFLK